MTDGPTKQTLGTPCQPDPAQAKTALISALLESQSGLATMEEYTQEMERLAVEVESARANALEEIGAALAELEGSDEYEAAYKAAAGTR